MKNVRKTNQTTLQVTTEQFSTDHVPESVRVDTTLTDAIGNDNILRDTITSIKDGVAPIPYFMYDGFLVFMKAFLMYIIEQLYLVKSYM